MALEESAVDKAVCKFRCTEVAQLEGGSERVKLSAQYDEALSEDTRFSKYTPQGDMTFIVSNPSLRGFYIPGQCYLIEMTPAE